MTILPKDPQVTERKSVILSDAERRNLRRKLKDSVDVAHYVLNPRNQLKRLVERNTAEAKRVVVEAAQVAKKNAPAIGAVGLGALLFASRRPIFGWISRLRKSKTNTPDGE